MTLTEIVAARKTIADPGKWQSGKMPRGAFPLSKSGNKAYRLANRRWRVVRFSAHGLSCRALINYSAELGQYQAMLGVEHETDIKVLARLEFHATHGTWHAHVTEEPIDQVPAGIKMGPWVKRVDVAGIPAGCPDDDASAYKVAIDYFRLDMIGGPLT